MDDPGKRMIDPFAQLFESLQFAALILDFADGRIGRVREANSSAARMAGYERAEIVGRRLTELFPSVTPQIEIATAAAIARNESVTRERRVATARGLVPAQVQYHPVAWTGEPAVLLIIRVLDDREVSEWLLRRRDTQLAKLSWATRRLNEVLEEEEILHRLVSSAVEVIGAAGGMTGMFEGDRIHYAEYVDVDGRRPLRLSHPAQAGVAGVLQRSSGVFRTNDAPREMPRDPAFEALLDPVTVLAAPMLDRDGNLLGCVELHDKVGGEPFTEHDGLILLGLATAASVALENARSLQELRRVREELLDDERRLRALAAELSRSEERARRRIAEELHDRIGQELAVLRMRLSQAAMMHGEGASTEMLGGIQRLVGDIIADTRSLTSEISPPMLYTLGLCATVEWLCERVEEQHGIAVRFQCDCHGCPLPDDTRALLYVSVRELLRNVVKHARASSAEVIVTTDGEAMVATVRDDGVGFMPEVPTETFGLFSVRERVAASGGAMCVVSAPGAGTEVTIRVLL